MGPRTTEASVGGESASAGRGPGDDAPVTDGGRRTDGGRTKRRERPGSDTAGDADERATGRIQRGEDDHLPLEPSDVERWFSEWVLLSGDRLHVAAAGALSVLVVVALLELAGLVSLAGTSALIAVFGGFLGGNLTLVTVVVSINQLLLSREFATPGELRTQIENVIDYRRDIEEAAGRVAPVEPLEFLELLFENTRQEAQRLGGLTFDGVPPELRREIDNLVANVTTHVDLVDGLLDQSGTGTFDVLSVTLSTNYARQINRIRLLRSEHGDELPDHVMESLENLCSRFQDIDIARQYFKSIYLQEELSSLSRLLLLVGGLSEAVAVSALLTLSGTVDAGLTRPVLLALLPVAVAVCFLPLAVLASVVLRAATVTRRTTTTIPFTTPQQEQ